MTSQYEYRSLGVDDIRLMRDLLGVFAEAFREPGTYLSAQPSDTYLVDLLSNRHFIAIIAAAEGEVVGGLTAYVLRKPEQERSEIYIYDLAVASPHRRKGIATALIRRLHAQAKAYNAWVMFVQADPPDEPAIRLYASLGRRQDVYHFDIRVT
jgi:aminoglycoside 3-N-acetyltransferase I